MSTLVFTTSKPALAFIEGKLPAKLTEALEQWFMSANVLPRSKKNHERNLQIYKLVVNERRPLEDVAALFELSAHFVKQIVRKICCAINAKFRREESNVSSDACATNQIPAVTDVFDTEESTESNRTAQDETDRETPSGSDQECDYPYHATMSGPDYCCPACGEFQQRVIVPPFPKPRASPLTVLRDAAVRIKRWIHGR